MSSLVRTRVKIALAFRPNPFLHVGVIVGWLGYLLLLRTVAPHVVAREWGIRANGGFSCEVLLNIAEERYNCTVRCLLQANGGLQYCLVLRQY